MALINCIECGEKVSTTAEACPHCGAKIPEIQIRCDECGNITNVENEKCSHCGAFFDREVHPNINFRQKKKKNVGCLTCIFIIIVGIPLVSYTFIRMCGYSHDRICEILQPYYMQTSTIETKTKNFINSEKDIIELGLKCVEVNLIKERRNIYTGIAEFHNGEKTKIKVTKGRDMLLFEFELPESVIRKKVEKAIDEIFENSK